MAACQQHAQLVQGAGGGGQRSRGGQGQGAGAGGHEQGEHDPEGATGVYLPPGETDRGGRHQNEQQEPLRHAVGDFRQAWFFALRPIQQAHDGRQARGIAQRLHFDGQRAFDVQRASGNAVADATWQRQVLAGEQRFVDTGLAGEDAPVGGNQRAGLHQHLLTFAQLAEQDALALAVGVQAQAGGRQQLDQLRRSGGCAFSCTALQVAPGEQEQREHAHGVEIQFALAGDGRPDAGHVGTADGQRYRDVHGQMAGTQVAQGTAEELTAAVEDDGRGEKQAGPAQDLVQLRRQVDVEFRPGGHGRHHHLHPQQPGHAQLAHAPAVFRGHALCRLVGAPGVGGVTDAA